MVFRRNMKFHSCIILLVVFLSATIGFMRTDNIKRSILSTNANSLQGSAFIFSEVRKLLDANVTKSVLNIEISQDIERCTQLQYMTDHNADLAFQHTVAHEIYGIDYSNVTVLVVEEAPSIFRSRKLTVSSITIDYRVTLNFLQAGYADEATAFKIFKNELESSIESGNFSLIMQRMAVLYKSHSLRNATSSLINLRISDISMPPIQEPTTGPDPITDVPEEDTFALTEAEHDIEYGVLIGTVIGVALFLTISVFCIRQSVRGRYFKGNTVDDDIPNKETEMVQNDEAETVVWFNSQPSGTST